MIRSVFVLTVLVALCGSLQASEDQQVAPTKKVTGGVNYDRFHGFGKVPTLEPRGLIPEEVPTGDHIRSERQTNEKEQGGIFPFSDFDIKHILNVFPKDDKDGEKFELPEFMKNILNMPKQVLKKICQFAHAFENMDDSRDSDGSKHSSGPCDPRPPRWGRWDDDDYPIKRNHDRYPEDRYSEDRYPPGIRRPEDYPYPGGHHERYPHGRYPPRHDRNTFDDEDDHRKRSAEKFDDDFAEFDTPSHPFPLDRFPGPKFPKKHEDNEHSKEDKHDKQEKKKASDKE